MPRIYTNYNNELFNRAPKIKNGSISINFNFNDYPRATIVEYDFSERSVAIGTKITINTIDYLCESSEVKVLPNSVPNNNKFRFESTSNYVHPCKYLLEFNIPLKKFVDENKTLALNGTKDEYYIFEIATLVDYALSKFKLPGSIQTADLKFKTNKNPNRDETITIKELLDSALEVKNCIYSYLYSRCKLKEIKKSDTVALKAVSDITKSNGPLTYYSNAVLTWGNNENKIISSRNFGKLVEIRDDGYILYEGDFQPQIPPPSGVIPRDLSPVMDIGGITKEFKITSHRYGQPETELTGVFGYAHAALELVSDPERPNTQTIEFLNSIQGNSAESGNALQELASTLIAEHLGYPSINLANEMTWRLISVKQKNYKYKSLGITINPQIKQADGSYIPVTVPEVYQPLLNPSVEALAEENTFGWELRRFQPEDPQKWTMGSIDAYLKLKAAVEAGSEIADGDEGIYNMMIYRAKCNLEQYLWRKIPIWEKVSYSIEPFSDYYKDSANVQWTIENIPRNELPEYKGTEDDTPIPVLFPDPSWVPELMVTSKSRFTSSIAAIGNPNFNPFQPSYYEINPTTIFSGSETQEYIQYGILPSKNTLKEVNSLFKKFVNINDLSSSVQTGTENAGTLYPIHPFMKVNDYGLSGTQQASINTITGNFPTRSDADIDRYATYSTIKTASDNSFKSNLATSQFSISEGRPPSATLRTTGKKLITTADLEPGLEESVTYISSSKSPGATNITNIDVPAANTLKEALTAAEHRLIIQALQRGNVEFLCDFSSSKRLVSSYNILNSCSEGRITSITAEQQVINGKPVVQPAQVQCIKLPSNFRITFKTIKYKSADDTQNNTASADVKIKVNITSYINPSKEAPVNYSRWT